MWRQKIATFDECWFLFLEIFSIELIGDWKKLSKILTTKEFYKNVVKKFINLILTEVKKKRKEFDWILTWILIMCREGENSWKKGVEHFWFLIFIDSFCVDLNHKNLTLKELMRIRTALNILLPIFIWIRTTKLKI